MGDGRWADLMVNFMERWVVVRPVPALRMMHRCRRLTGCRLWAALSRGVAPLRAERGMAQRPQRRARRPAAASPRRGGGRMKRTHDMRLLAALASGPCDGVAMLKCRGVVSRPVPAPRCCSISRRGCARRGGGARVRLRASAVWVWAGGRASGGGSGRGGRTLAAPMECISLTAAMQRARLRPGRVLRRSPSDSEHRAIRRRPLNLIFFFFLKKCMYTF